tara:strand:+ start:3127 stop:3390 length:264 start_codon:yes stop_codon:yes gene_type:complete
LTDLKKKILWQCRRGLWELDTILIPFVEINYDGLDNEGKEMFKQLLSLEDIEIFDLLVNKKDPKDMKIKPLIDLILSSHMKNLEKKQ